MSSLMIAHGIDRPSPAERLRLISEILDSLPEPIPAPMTDELEHELDRRLAMMDAEPGALSPWAEVEARVLERLKR